ncbi:MAG: hypothetical protein B7Z15_15255 [Rhizobiales bacterium 32-66-8]|nr:MAG: hypothetical protein B7Z15_15255 [Rhizobiales bacterium 32-66-8]
MMLFKLARLAVAAALLLGTMPAGAQTYDPFATMRPGQGAQPQYQPPQNQRPQLAQPYDRGYDRDYDRGGRGYDRGYDRGPRYYDERPRYYEERPRYREGGRGGSLCVTSRGTCRMPPQPRGASCRCDIDGLIKRGIIQ